MTPKAKKKKKKKRKKERKKEKHSYNLKILNKDTFDELNTLKKKILTSLFGLRYHLTPILNKNKENYSYNLKILNKDTFDELHT